MVAHCPKDYLVKLEALKPQRFVVLEKQKEMDKKGAKRQAPPAPVESSKRQALAISLEQALEGSASTPARKPALGLGTPSPSTTTPTPLRSTAEGIANSPPQQSPPTPSPLGNLTPKAAPPQAPAELSSLLATWGT